MSATILAVRTEDLRNVMGGKHFLALPQEEIDRHFASIEVFEVERKAVDIDPALKQLVAFAALHHNYSWLTYRSLATPGALGTATGPFQDRPIGAHRTNDLQKIHAHERGSPATGGKTSSSNSVEASFTTPKPPPPSCLNSGRSVFRTSE